MSRKAKWIASENIGKTFGRWLVLKDAGRGRIENEKAQSVLVLCICTCGSKIEKIRSLPGIAMHGGSCGCLKKESAAKTLRKNSVLYKEKLRNAWAPIEDYIGMTYNKLTIVNIDTLSNIPHESIAECLCECGNKKLAKIKSLKSGSIKSCGCGRFRKRNQEEIKEMMSDMRMICKTEEDRALFNDYSRWKAEVIKHHAVEISFNDWKEIVRSPCYYTGILPDQRLKIKKTINIFVHGVDRIDSSKGYIKDNCVPCQAKINRMKSAQDVESFIILCNQVANKHYRDIKSR